MLQGTADQTQGLQAGQFLFIKRSQTKMVPRYVLINILGTYSTRNKIIGVRTVGVEQFVQLAILNFVGMLRFPRWACDFGKEERDRKREW